MDIIYRAKEPEKLLGNPQNLSVEEIYKRINAHNIPIGKPEEAPKWMMPALNSEEIIENYPIRFFASANMIHTMLSANMQVD